MLCGHRLCNCNIWSVQVENESRKFHWKTLVKYTLVGCYIMDTVIEGGGINPMMLRTQFEKLTQELTSGSMILKTIILELHMVLQNIWKKVVGYDLFNISPSNIFLFMLLPARFNQNCQVVLAAVSINGLTFCWKLLVMICLTFLHQIISYLCFCLQDFIKIVMLLMAAVSING